MKTYTIYAVTTTVRIVLTFFILTMGWDFFFPPIITVILAICNDGTMITISQDRVTPSDKPDKWNLRVIFGMAIVLGTYLTCSTISLFAIEHHTNILNDWFNLKQLTRQEERAMIFLNVSITGLGTIFLFVPKNGFGILVLANGLLLPLSSHK